VLTARLLEVRTKFRSVVAVAPIASPRRHARLRAQDMVVTLVTKAKSAAEEALVKSFKVI